MVRNLLYAITGMLLLSMCKPVSQIQTGDDAFRYKRYPEAVKMLEEEIEKSNIEDEQARKSYWIGESYRLMNDDEASIDWYRKAYELSPNQISLEAYANAVLRSQQYTNAKKLYQKLIDDYGQDELWQNAVKSCDAAAIWIREQNPEQFTIVKSPLNSSVSDFSPVFYQNIIVFTSDRTDAEGGTYHWTGHNYTDFFRNAEDNKLDALLSKINGPYNEAAIAFSPDLNRAIYTQCGTLDEESLEERCTLIEAIYSEGERIWSTFRELDFCREDVSYGHPTFFDSGEAIIFSSDDFKGIGGRDLWVSRIKDGKWGKPVRLPPGINTSGDEMFPRMNGDTLYFSSNGKIGMGGLDIFMTRWLPPDGWSAPVNLKPPVNSGGDDFGYVEDPTFRENDEVIRRFLISSNRIGSLQDDIYVFEENRLVPRDTTTVKDEEDYDIVIEGKVLEQLYAIPGDPNSAKTGTRPLPNARVTIKNKPRMGELPLDSTAAFTKMLNEEGPYRFIANYPGYLSGSQFVNVELSEEDRAGGGKTYLVQIVLDPIVYNKEIVMEDIYYDFDKSNIREDAEPSLQELGELLTDNPEIRIELASHTDCRGLEIYNAELSQKRAQSAVNYLKGLGIAGNRMRAKGYGEQKPAVDCECESCTEDEHQANRRTSFTILR